MRYPTSAFNSTSKSDLSLLTPGQNPKTISKKGHVLADFALMLSAFLHTSSSPASCRRACPEWSCIFDHFASATFKMIASLHRPTRPIRSALLQFGNRRVLIIPDSAIPLVYFRIFFNKRRNDRAAAFAMLSAGSRPWRGDCGSITHIIWCYRRACTFGRLSSR